jgi:hypothetical protein
LFAQKLITGWSTQKREATGTYANTGKIAQSLILGSFAQKRELTGSVAKIVLIPTSLEQSSGVLAKNIFSRKC